MRVTFQQGLGKYNSQYWTVLVWPENEDSHWFHRRAKESSNWMPKHSEIESLLEALIKVEGPCKRAMLAQMFHDAIDRGLESEEAFNL